MFNPSREQVRQFFFDAWRKYRQGAQLEGLETIAVEAALMHPEYHEVLDQPERYLDRDYTPEEGQSNPFLHMSMHVAIAEQLSIDQPPGIRAEFERLVNARGDRHEALHEVLECLGETVWRAQRDRTPPDAEAYLECLRRR
ncbi:MAG TPA: DUF1841 family protein [Burkholderiales bacterium]|nr:DUF1841 family protein [Burkholderiales bacterium]